MKKSLIGSVSMCALLFWAVCVEAGGGTPRCSPGQNRRRDEAFGEDGGQGGSQLLFSSEDGAALKEVIQKIGHATRIRCDFSFFSDCEIKAALVSAAQRRASVSLNLDANTPVNKVYGEEIRKQGVAVRFVPNLHAKTMHLTYPNGAEELLMGSPNASRTSFLYNHEVLLSTFGRQGYSKKYFDTARRAHDELDVPSPPLSPRLRTFFAGNVPGFKHQRLEKKPTKRGRCKKRPRIDVTTMTLNDDEEVDHLCTHSRDYNAEVRFVCDGSVLQAQAGKALLLKLHKAGVGVHVYNPYRTKRVKGKCTPSIQHTKMLLQCDMYSEHNAPFTLISSANSTTHAAFQTNHATVTRDPAIYETCRQKVDQLTRESVPWNRIKWNEVPVRGGQ